MFSVLIVGESIPHSLAVEPSICEADKTKSALLTNGENPEILNDIFDERLWTDAFRFGGSCGQAL